MQRKRICILSGSHLCHNPRVVKEASTLAGAGFEVEVLGAWFDSELKSRDRNLLQSISFKFVPVIDLTVSPARRAFEGAKAKLGRSMYQIAGIENRWQLGFAVDALTKAVRERAADLFIAHSEQALWALSRLQMSGVSGQRSEMRGQRSLVSGPDIGVDFEDWFSEDLLPEARKSRPIRLLRSLEQKVLNKGGYATCTSRAMAEALAREYGCEPLTVIYNAFRWSDRETIDGLIKDRNNPQLPSLHWYSQTLGRGRGLEDLIAALPLLESDLEIHLRGKPTRDFSELLERVPKRWRNRVFVHDLVSNEELLSRIAEHDIGFAGEQKYCRSRDLTITNKILHYLLAGLAVIASDTAGQCEVAQQAKRAVLIYRAGDPQHLATQLDSLLPDVGRLKESKAAALSAAQQTFCWERMAPLLIESVEKASG